MKKIFNILDDVWKEFNLADIGIPFGDNHKGCKVLLTTRLQHVCTRMGSQKKIQLDVSSNDEAWTLFKHNAGLSDVSGYGKLDDVAQEVARECRGLPLAIVTIARALREKSLDELIVANQQLKSSQLVENQDFCQDIYGCLKFSYDYLKGRKIKSCFLLCSHFPEDYEISMEQLTRYAIGQGLFQDADFIEDARRETRVVLTNLQYAGLLLDTGDAETVKMHDVVRDFAHWIASEGENRLMIKTGLGLKEWPHSESLACFTTISLMENKIGHLPEGLECPNLETLLLCGNQLARLSGASLKGMKTLEVLTLSGGLMISLEGLQFLTNLRSLCLVGSKLCDISPVGKLKKLERLDLRGCYLDKMPDELGELNSLRLLGLSYVGGNWKIPSNLIRKLYKLDELYIGDFSFSQWTIGGTYEEYNSASLSELNSLTRLTALTMKANSVCFPRDFVFPKLQTYKIAINQWFDYGCPSSRSLKIAGLPLTAFKELFCDIEYLDLDSTLQGYPVPHYTVQQHVPAIALFNLAELFMEDMIHLKELRHGLHPTRFLHKLREFTAKNCPAMIFTVPIVKNLREATVINCPRLLELELLPNLRCIWQEPIHRVSLQSLRTVKEKSCEKLTSLLSGACSRNYGSVRLEITVNPATKLAFRGDKVHLIWNLTVGNCEEIFRLEDAFFLSRLDNLYLKDLQELQVIWKGPTQVATLQHLTPLEIVDCKRLRHLFTHVWSKFSAIERSTFARM
ncbi:hypothetical protein CRYUN_Cryun25bG0015600 [Craigia yunnanensis]